MAFQGSKIPFLAIFDVFFACFLFERGPKIFFRPKFFFFEKFDPKSIQNVLFGCHNSFWQITLYFVEKTQKSFSPIFQYKLASSRKVRSKNPGGMVFAWKAIQKLLDMNARDPNGARNALNS